MNIIITDNWNGTGKHPNYGSSYQPTLSGEIYFTSIIETRNISTKTSTFNLANNITYPAKFGLYSDPVLFQNQSYTIKLGGTTRTGTIPDNSNDDLFAFQNKVPFPDLVYSVQHSGDITVPYSLNYSATVKVDQNTEVGGGTNYKTFSVSVTYSGNFQSKGFYGLYGSVGNKSKLVIKLYGSVNGQSKEIKKLYGSVNGVSKRIY